MRHPRSKRKSTGDGGGSAGGAVWTRLWGAVGWKRAAVNQGVKPLPEREKWRRALMAVLSVPPPEGQPDPDPGGEGDPGGVGPVPAALRPLHALHPGGAGRVRHLLLPAPALTPTHEGEAGQPGN